MRLIASDVKGGENVMDPKEAIEKYKKFWKSIFGDDVFRDIGIVEVSMPLLNIEEKRNQYRYIFHIPGYEKRDINIEVSENSLIISGNKRVKEGKKGKNYIYKEINESSFKRVVPLPIDANPDKLKAEFKNGVLTITIPKKKAKRKKIKVL